MKNTLIAATIAASLSISSVALAGNDWKSESKDAWIDGRAETTLLFNSHLSAFDINTDVKNGEVLLTGKVDNSVDKKLASELIMGIDGVTNVDNELVVVNKKESDMSKDLTDKKISTVVTSRYLFNTDVPAVNIDIDVDDGAVTLNGTVDSDSQRQLAVQIAENTDDVTSVTDNLVIADSE